MDLKVYLYKKQLEIKSIQKKIDKIISDMIVIAEYIPIGKAEDKDILRVLKSRLKEEKIKFDISFQNLLNLEKEINGEKEKELCQKTLDRVVTNSNSKCKLFQTVVIFRFLTFKIM